MRENEKLLLLQDYKVNKHLFDKFGIDYDKLLNKPDLSTVATTGDYEDLLNKPDLPDFPSLSTVATTGSYNDLIDKPTLAIATTTANGLMSSADKTKLDGVKAGANNYAHPAKHAPSVITQDSSNRFVTDAEKASWNGKATQATIDTSIDNIEVGGVNLLIQKSITRGKYLLNTGNVHDDAGWFYSDYIPVSDIKNLTTSGYTNLGMSPSTCYYDSNKAFVKGVNNNSQSLAKLMTIDSNIKYIRFSGMIADLPTLKIEKGNKATDWTPAPEDVDSALKLKVEKADVDSAIDASIENIQIGGRNLILDTSTPIAVAGTGEINQTGILWRIDSNKVAGKQITVSYDAVCSTNTGKFELLVSAPPWYIGDARHTASTVNQYISYTYTMPATTGYTRLTLGLDSLIGTVTISNLKIELGNKATDWTPAPEDMAYKTTNGITSARPIPTYIGQTHFDTTLGKPIWCKTISPIAWVDSTGLVC